MLPNPSIPEKKKWIASVVTRGRAEPHPALQVFDVKIIRWKQGSWRTRQN